MGFSWDVVSTILVVLLICHFSFLSADAIPFMNDGNLQVQTYAKGLKFPTTMEFIGFGDLLVAEKDTGRVFRILNGSILPEPVIDLNVSNGRGLFGIASENRDNRTFVYLTFLASNNNSDSDDMSMGTAPRGNVLYQYEMIGGKLIHPIIMLNTSALPVEMADPILITITRQ